MGHEHIGSGFDDFLSEEAMLEEATAVAIKRVIAWQINEAMKLAAAEARNGIAQLMEKARSSGALQQKAQEVKPQATRAAWITFGALLASLLAAVIGAMAGRRNPAQEATA